MPSVASSVSPFMIPVARRAGRECLRPSRRERPCRGTATSAARHPLGAV